jgi:hypothetical protein
MGLGLSLRCNRLGAEAVHGVRCLVRLLLVLP